MDRNGQDKTPGHSTGRELSAGTVPVAWFESAAARQAGSPAGAPAAVLSAELPGAAWVGPARQNPEWTAATEFSRQPTRSVTEPGRELVNEISQRVIELKSLKLDALTVVLRPDEHTELFLQLNRHDGVVEVKAQCERGDYGSLNGQWAELQRALEPKGIRLGELEMGGSAAGQFSRDGAESFEQGRAGGEPWGTELPEGVAPTRERRTGTASSPAGHRSRGRAACSWETWA